MLDETDKVLAEANYDTKTLTISDDATLGVGDIDRIAQTITRCPLLEKVVVSGCNLSTDMVKPLTKVITAHPSITAVDLSRNNIEYLDVLVPLVGVYEVHEDNSFYWCQHRNINELNIAGNKAELNGSSCKRFIESLVAADHIAVLTASFDPWDYEGTFTGFLDGYKKVANAIKWSFNIERGTDYAFADNLNRSVKYKTIDDAANANFEQAKYVLHRVTNAITISTDDVNNLNARFPAVLYAAQQKFGHEKAEEVLKEFHVRAKAETGLETDLFSYIKKKPAPSAPVKTTFAPVAASSQDVRGILSGLPPITTDSARQMILGFRSTPSQVIKIGEATLEAYSKIAASSLTYVNALPSTQPSESLLADFKHAMDEVVGVVEKMAGRKLDGTALAAPVEQPKGFWGHVAHAFSSSPPPPSFELLKPEAEKAAGLLRAMVPKIVDIKTQNARLLETNNAMMDGYAALTDRLGAFIAVSREIVRDDRQATAGQPKSMFINALEERGRLLDQENQRINQEGMAHQTRSSFLQQQDTKLLASQRALTLLGASVEGFVKQVYQANGSAMDTTSAMGKVKDIMEQARNLETELTGIGQLYEAERRNANAVFFKKTAPPAAPAAPAPAA